MNRGWYRRSRRLVAYWREGALVLHPYMTHPAMDATSELIDLLSLLSAWTSVEAYAKATGLNRRHAGRFLQNLARLGLVDRTFAPAAPEPETAWDVWQEAAAFLHFSTRHNQFRSERETRARLVRHALEQPPPPPTKLYEGRPRIELRGTRRLTPFEAVAHRRRTWRRFGGTAPGLSALTSLLDLTFRVRRWIDLGPSGRVMLRTSPSGGARHPTEAYVLVRRVKGLAAGAYYYAPAEHALIRVRPGPVSGGEITKWLVGQHWYGSAAAVVVMTAVFERTAWKYRTARSYKSVLLEAGHFAQTWCLGATARGLAPFCTGAFDAPALERALGLNPKRESVVYVAGFGVRPPGVGWAPWPAGEDVAAE